MIHYLKIVNFSAINDEVELNFEVTTTEDDAYEVQMQDGKRLLKLAYIYGPNASGKTTILKAFEFVRRLTLRPLDSKDGLLAFEPFLFRERPLEVPTKIELAFYMDETRYVYNLEVNTRFVLLEKLVAYRTVKPTEVFSRYTDTDKRLTQIDFGSSIKAASKDKDLLESNTLHNNTVLGAFAKTNVDIPELNKLNKWFSTFLMPLIFTEGDIYTESIWNIQANKTINSWVNTFLHKADNQISKIVIGDTKGDGINIEVQHKLKSGAIYTLPINRESHGTQRYLGLGPILYYLIHESRFLPVDELESSLHPDLTKHFLQTFLLNANHSQLIFTTHQTALMEETDFIRRDALWFTEKKDDGSIALFSAADFDTSKLRKDASLINAYRAGRLGAKPNLGSPFLKEK